VSGDQGFGFGLELFQGLDNKSYYQTIDWEYQTCIYYIHFAQISLFKPRQKCL